MFLRIAIFLSFSIYFSEKLSANNNYPFGAREAGMSNATVMLPGFWSVSHNQAGLGAVENVTLGIYHENRYLLKEMGMHSLALAIPTSGGTLAATVSSFGYSKYHENKFGLAIGRAFTENFMAGIQLNYFRRYIAEGYGNTGAVSFEGGVIIKPIEGLFIGAHVFNPVQSKYEELSDEAIPFIFRLGAGYQFYNKLLLTIENEKEMDASSVLRAGLEFQLIDNIYLRTGIASNPSKSSFGAGFNFKNIKADIAFTYQAIGVTPHFSLQYFFK